MGGLGIRKDLAAVRAVAAKAATNPALWPETLWRLSQLIGSDMTLFEHIDKVSGRVEHGFTDRPDLVAATRDAYANHFYRINPRYDVARSRPLHDITHDHLLGDERTLDRYEFYADFLRPSGLKYFIGSAVADDAQQTVTLSLQRNADRGRVDADGRRAFTALLPDLRNAMAMYLRTIHAPAGSTLAEAFDCLADPIAILRHDTRLVFANQAMCGLLAAGDIASLRDGALIGADDAVAAALARAMRGALAGPGSAMAPALGSPGPIIIRLSPLAPDQAHEFVPNGDRLLCLMIDDPARPNWPDVGEAMILYSLTRREANVGVHLANGLTIPEIAQRMGVSRNTIRTHLAQVREKLGVHSALAVSASLRRATSPFT